MSRSKLFPYGGVADRIEARPMVAAPDVAAIPDLGQASEPPGYREREGSARQAQNSVRVVRPMNQKHAAAHSRFCHAQKERR
jgi:hypothetical protein